MAPRGSKRTTTISASSPKKKTRVDPAHTGIVATLEVVDNLNERCREMLIGMVGPSLATPACERHGLQQLGVNMIQQTLDDHKKKLMNSVDTARQSLQELEGSKTVLLQTLESAKADLEEKNGHVAATTSASEIAREVLHVSQAALAEKKGHQKASDSKHEAVIKEKDAIQSAYEQYFKAPLDAGEAINYGALDPFVPSLGLEDSLTTALSSCCGKAKDQRGSFDNLVIGQFGEALEAKIVSLEKNIADEVSSASQMQAEIASAETQTERDSVSAETKLSELENAVAAMKAAEDALRKASEEWSAFEPGVQEAAEHLNVQDALRMDFEEGALKDFFNLRDKATPVPLPVEEEAAIAGA